MITANVTAWNDEQRRNGSYVVLGAAIVLTLAALSVWYFASGTPEWVYWTFVGLLALVLVFMAVLLFVSPARAAESAPEPAPDAMAAPSAMAEATAEAPAVPAFEPRVLTLRCGDCGTIFDLTDTGERPLYHTCPGCGAEGALRDEPVAAAAAPESAMAPEVAAEAAPPAPAPYAAQPMAPAAAAPPAAPVKRIKLRCGGCKEVFSIEDTGERPLKRACPHCGRMGQIN